MKTIIDKLVASEEPSVRYKVRVGVLGEDPNGRAIKRLAAEIKQSPRVTALLKNRDGRGRIEPVRHVYQKWTGAHWVFARLADIGYPPGGKELIPIRDQIFDCWLMNPHFVELHYPCYWRYDILFGLKIMAEAGFIRDKRCTDALDLLESKRLPGGGWPAEARFYGTSKPTGSGRDLVSWGGVSKKKMNEWVTADALFVLEAAGRAWSDT